MVGGGRCEHAHPSGRCLETNQGPPARSVTIAPARSAISPAAATSHGERPFVWLKASKRPFAT